jgi:hypothetical protein
MEFRILYLSAFCLKTYRLIDKKTVMLFVGLYGYETWYLALRKEHRLRMFVNNVLTRGKKCEGVEKIT